MNSESKKCMRYVRFHHKLDTGENIHFHSSQGERRKVHTQQQQHQARVVVVWKARKKREKAGSTRKTHNRTIHNSVFVEEMMRGIL
jgi:hypothetical protein